MNLLWNATCSILCFIPSAQRCQSYWCECGGLIRGGCRNFLRGGSGVGQRSIRLGTPSPFPSFHALNFTHAEIKRGVRTSGPPLGLISLIICTSSRANKTIDDATRSRQ
uniref:Putative secreted protein n=1 Tax=Ixodes ricinus TaxID=34613 RepID=A0A6B0UAD6_IXORI